MPSGASPAGSSGSAHALVTRRSGHSFGLETETVDPELAADPHTEQVSAAECRVYLFTFSLPSDMETP